MIKHYRIVSRGVFTPACGASGVRIGELEHQARNATCPKCLNRAMAFAEERLGQAQQEVDELVAVIERVGADDPMQKRARLLLVESATTLGRVLDIARRHDPELVIEKYGVGDDGQWYASFVATLPRSKWDDIDELAECAS